MQRSTTILVGILLGALAAGLGIGLFLKKANDDRKRLAEQIDKTMQEASAAREENRQAIEEANKKLQAASIEVAKAQQFIKSLEEERKLLSVAKPLLIPSSKSIRGWTDVISLDLGVSLKQPFDSKIETNDRQTLTLVKSNVTETTDPRWFSLSKYDARLESELISALATSTPVSYLVNGRILIGVQGTLPNRKEPLQILRVRYEGQIIHLIWIRDLSRYADGSVMMDVLASLKFEN